MAVYNANNAVDGYTDKDEGECEEEDEGNFSVKELVYELCELWGLCRLPFGCHG